MQNLVQTASFVSLFLYFSDLVVEICSRLFIKKQFLANPPSRIAGDVLRLTRVCANGGSVASVASAKKLSALLKAEAANVRSIAPPSFQGQVRYGKLLDVPSHDVPQDPADRHLMRGASNIDQAGNNDQDGGSQKSTDDPR